MGTALSLKPTVLVKGLSKFMGATLDTMLVPGSFVSSNCAAECCFVVVAVELGVVVNRNVSRDAVRT